MQGLVYNSRFGYSWDNDSTVHFSMAYVVGKCGCFPSLARHVVGKCGCFPSLARHVGLNANKYDFENSAHVNLVIEDGYIQANCSENVETVRVCSTPSDGTVQKE